MAKITIEVPDATLAEFAEAYAAYAAALAPRNQTAIAEACAQLARVYDECPVVKTREHAMYVIVAINRAERYWSDRAVKS